MPNSQDESAPGTPISGLADNSPSFSTPGARLAIRASKTGILHPPQILLHRTESGRKCYESCRRSRSQQFVANQRRRATSARTELGTGENACQRRLLHRRTSDARTLSRTLSPNLRPRAGGRDRCRGPRRHRAQGGRPRGQLLDSIHLRALRMVPTWSQNVLSLHEGHRNGSTRRARRVYVDEYRRNLSDSRPGFLRASSADLLRGLHGLRGVALGRSPAARAGGRAWNRRPWTPRTAIREGSGL